MSDVSDMLGRFRRKRSYCRRRGIPFELTFKQFCEIAKTGGSDWLMVQSVPNDGYVVGNVEMLPRFEAFRRNMDLHYGGERMYLP
jgi:hypothetical protein